MQIPMQKPMQNTHATYIYIFFAWVGRYSCARSFFPGELQAVAHGAATAKENPTESHSARMGSRKEKT